MKNPSKIFFSYFPSLLDDIIRNIVKKEFKLISEDFKLGLITAKEAIKLIKIQLKKIEDPD